MRALLLLGALLLAACQSAAAPGASCARSSECPSGLACAYGRCRSQCLTTRDCAAGTECLRDAAGNGGCALPVVDTCERVTLPCVEGLVCVGATCRQSCATLGCAPGSTCRGGLEPVCVADDLDGGTRADVGPRDAAGGDAAPTPLCEGDGGTCALGTCADPIPAEWGRTYVGTTVGGPSELNSAGEGACFVGSERPERVYALPAQPGDVTITLDSPTDLALYVRGTSMPCDVAQELTCVDLASGDQSEIVTGQLSASTGTVYVVVDGCESTCTPAATGAGDAYSIHFAITP